MSGDRSDIEAIKARLDIVQVVQRYVQLRPAGERWTGVCPFHEETKPSLSVSSAMGVFYCFGCQASGDVIDFYSRINGLEFAEALRDLAEETGVQLRGKPDARAMTKRPHPLWAAALVGRQRDQIGMRIASRIRETP